MIVRRPSTRLLRSGVSVVALAEAWALPGTAQAQTCGTGATIDGVGPGTAVTCPGGTQLDFPGAVVVGPFTIPNGSTLTGLATGTNPTHQGWSYTDPSGNPFTVFIQGTYNLRNGIGGTTVLDGPNILGLSGAGSCGAGAQLCPGPNLGLGPSISNASGGGGGGVSGGFLLPTVTLPPSGAMSFVEASDADLTGVACGGGGWGCSGETTESLASFFEGIDPAVADAYDRCSESGGSCTYVLLPEDGDAGTFHYGPVVDAVEPARSVPADSDDTITITGLHFDDHLYSDPSGTNVYFATDPAVDTDMIADLLKRHTENVQLLLGSSQQNEAGASGGGVQSSFSLPSADGQFLFTAPVDGDGKAYVVSFPLATGETGAYQCDQGGCAFVIPNRAEGENDYTPPTYSLPANAQAFSDLLEGDAEGGINFKDPAFHIAFAGRMDDGEANLAAALLLLLGDRTTPSPPPD